MNTLIQDLRYAARSLRRSPGFTAVAVVTLALGIGANTAVFDVVYALLLRPLPVKDPHQLVVLAGTGAGGDIGFSHPLFRAVLERQRNFEGVFALTSEPVSFSEASQTERVSGQLVSGNFFCVVGVGPEVGRVLSEGDDAAPSGERVAVISHGFWVRRFGRDRGVVGRTVQLNGHPFTVVGVARRGFFGVEVGRSPDIWVPLMTQPLLSQGQDQVRSWNRFGLQVMARLKPGGSAQATETATNLLCGQIYQDAPLQPALRDFLSGTRLEVRPAGRGPSSAHQQFAHPLVILVVVAALVLVIGCVDLANLLLARADARRPEVAMRLSLGAGWGRLFLQFLIEGLLLSASGALCAALVAWWLTGVLLGYFTQVGFSAERPANSPALLFAAGLAVLTGVSFGLASAVYATRLPLHDALKGQPTASGIAGCWQGRRLLVVSQMAMSLVLLVGAALFVRTLHNLKAIDLGFSASSVLLLSIDPARNGYDREQESAFYAQLLERVGADPGVRSASIADAPYLAGAWIDGLSVEGFVPAPGLDMSVSVKMVGPAFFETMGVALLAGREFAHSDNRDGPPVAIVNRSLAREFFGTTDAIGRRVGIGGEPDRVIVAVVDDATYSTLRENAPRTAYLPLAQSPLPAAPRTLHVKSAGDPRALAAPVRAAVAALDPHLPVYDVRTFNELIDQKLVQERLVATLSSWFGVLALLLAALGLYGVTSYSTARRTREIGIRMALGARRGQVLGRVIADAMVLVLAGIVVGVPVALLGARLVAGRLFGLTPADPSAMAFSIIVLIAVGLLAGYVPARRAANVNPVVALRHE